jgi:hypothetical protein
MVLIYLLQVVKQNDTNIKESENNINNKKREIMRVDRKE